MSSTRLDGLESELACQLFLGGQHDGAPRLGTLAHFAIPDERLDEAIDVLLRRYLDERSSDERFSSVDRVGADALAERLNEAALAVP